VQRVVEGYAPLHGMKLTAADGASLRVAPFVTSNHPLLATSGSWAAMDARLANAELVRWRAIQPAGTGFAAAPTIMPLAPGSRVLVSLPVAVEDDVGTNGTTALAAKPTAATLESILGTDGTDTEGAAAYVGAVYSLELDAASYAVYIVNGLLAMD